ncbi:MAG: hypothetical protein U9P37_01920 [Pseudomonadota bacterium]|nr:hypothetical protein [Pseudomonadota bacterium]
MLWEGKSWFLSKEIALAVRKLKPWLKGCGKKGTGIAYQFRTTYHPALFSESELEALALLFSEDEKPLLQKACPSGALSLDFRRNKDVTSLQFQEVTTIMRQLLKKNKKTEISG